MKGKWIGLIVAFVIVLGGCSNEKKEEVQEDPSVVTMVEKYSQPDTKMLAASITPQVLTVTDENGVEKNYDVTDEDFFVSIAPYEIETHPCTYHSLTGCQGEQVNQSFQVKVTDESGEMVVDREMNTGHNGFLDLWLPRGGTYTVDITAEDGKSTIDELSTFEDDPTCITSMQLS
ncbi:hypothetical protein N781_16060 [Pontibacillus halophilus JSM 076056 = DSM 19796]|uniref:Uncharacterized protein n=1 Tax=Pontibacillus halophilus JSM 076056 = DSM 19796 TaxID=1385510 RepID=A0A0A5GET6_9BACI|nr:CueP family metal-binding protein [Pontibacillus halophilus]KGX89733.1 hypothetical protein N781_16060 [Pontibacillus halophilus JSM 076056 = DSM 19796]